MSNEKDDKAAGGGKEQEEELVIVETDEAGKPLNNGQGTQDDGDADDDADDDDDHDDDDGDDDERHGHAEGDQDETPEAKRERRRTENKAKRIRNRIAAQGRERILQSQAETIADLTARLDKVEGRASRQDIGMLRNSLQQIESQQADAKRTHAELAKAGDWEGVAEVNEIQLTLREQHRNVTIALQRAGQQAADPNRGGNGKDDNADGQQGGRPKPKAVDPVVKAKANAWADKHSWLRDPQANPEEVAIVRAIDTTLANEGYDPKGDDYWTELGKRVRARLPNHYPKKAASNGSGGKNVDNGAGDNKPANRGPRMTPASQTGGGRRALKPNEVYISPARKQAMQDAGAWDDPEKRARMLKSYRAWDKEHPGESAQ